MLTGKEYKEYFDEDYFETTGYKSNYDKNNMTRDSYLHKAIACWMTQVLELGGGESILEVGCAFGWVVEQMIKTYSLDCYGQDISQYSVDNAPSVIQNRIKECEDFEIVFDKQFDLIYSLETFEHIPEDKISIYFENMYDALSTNGLVFCTICLGHNNDRGADIDRSHQTLQPRTWWNEKFEQAGFIVRKDLEAKAYELGLQTSEMERGEWLPREYNWHVFVMQKADTKYTEPIRIYDRRLMQLDNTKPKLLIVGDRVGTFQYPTADFFQIDNWGNYLSYFFDGEYQGLGNDNYKNIQWCEYDLMLTALDHNTVNELSKSDFNKCNYKIAFMAGTPSMVIENMKHRQRLLDILPKFDAVFAHAPQIKELLDTFSIDAISCSEIFPLRYFDSHYKPFNENEFTILCAGYFDSECSLSSYSVYLASRLADKVLIAIDSNRDDIDTIDIPNNVEIFKTLPQHKYYEQVLSQANLVLKMDNPTGVGRIIAEAAAGKIPSISGPDLFQIRCYPEFMVSGFDSISEIITTINYIRDNKYEVDNICTLSRERLKASNYQHFSIMINTLRILGYKVDIPEEIYW